MTPASNVRTNVPDSDWETKVEPYGDSWDFKKNPVLEGVYNGVKKVDFTDKKSGEIRATNVYEVENSEGKWSVWGSYNIDAAFTGDDPIPVGNLVRITFEGQADTSDGQRVNKFIVQTKKP